MQTAPIRAVKVSLESQIQGLHNDTTITGNGLGYLEMWPEEVDLVPQKNWPYVWVIFDREVMYTMTD